MISRSLARISVIALGLLLGVPTLHARYPAPGRVSDAEITTLMAMPERDQLANPRQGRLQTWFLENVTDYHDILSKSAIGASPLVNLGDMARIRAGFTAPTGHGNWRIEWMDRTHAGDGASPCWWRYDNVIQFSRGTAATYLRDDYTCWHELMHALLEPSVITANPADWRAYLNANGANDAHHVYLEALTQRTVDWLEYLNKTMRFEQCVRRALEDTEEYQKNLPGALPYDVERQIWSRAHDAWVQSWNDARRIAPLPANLRAEFTRLSGARLPTVEEVVTFYMNGGVVSKTGKPIPVPRWVMHAESLRAVVIIDRDPKADKSETKGDVHLTSLDVRVLQTYRGKNPAGRGNVTFRIEGTEGQAALDVKLGTKAAEQIPGGKAMGTRQVLVDLAQGLKEIQAAGSVFHLTASRGDLATLKKEETYRLVVDFQDVPDKAGETVYQSSKAVFFIRVKPGAPRSAASGGGTSGSSASSSTGAHAAWVLKNVERGVTDSDPVFTRKGRMKIEGDSLSGTTTRTSGGKTQQASFHVSWQAPAARLMAGDRLNLSISLAKLGGDLDVELTGGWMAMRTRGPTQRVEIQQITGCSLSNGGGANEPTSANKTEVWTVPDGNDAPAYNLDLNVGGTGAGAKGWAVYHYIWPKSSGTSAASSVTATSQVEGQPQPEQKADRILDNPVPKPGEIIPEVPPRKTDPPLPPPKVSVHWYTHQTTGDFRIRLTGSWRLRETVAAGTDTLEREDGLAIYCANGFGLVAGPEDAVLEEAMGRVLQGKALARPSVPCTMAQSRARRAAVYFSQSDLTLWYQIVAHNGRLYLLNIGAPGRPTPAPPDDAVALLERLRWMR